MTLGRPYIIRFTAGMLIGLGAIGGLFAVASAAASSLGSNFSLEQADSHRRNVQFEAGSAKFRNARQL